MGDKREQAPQAVRPLAPIPPLDHVATEAWPPHWRRCPAKITPQKVYFKLTSELKHIGV